MGKAVHLFAYSAMYAIRAYENVSSVPTPIICDSLDSIISSLYLDGPLTEQNLLFVLQVCVKLFEELLTLEEDYRITMSTQVSI